MANPNSSMNSLSPSVVAGIVIAGAVAIVLAIVLTIVFVRRRRNGDARDEEKGPGMLRTHASISSSYPQHTGASNPRLVRSVSKRNLTPSIILPLPVPPVPAARPRPPKFSLEPALHSSGRPMSSAELLAHHQAAGTMPRPFIPHTLARRTLTPAEELLAPRFSFASASFSRTSIVSPSLRSSLASSFRSSLASSGLREGSELLKVRHVFAPLLPDELVLRQNEKVTLIQSFDDGWCIVGRKSPFHAPAPGKPNEYAFGRGTPALEVEIGVVPSWVFEKRANGSTKPERPMRTESLGVTLLDQGNFASGEARDDVISWSNF